ncbi:hypothetical protein LX64_01926 [Chitinophaga skermanii]|uniref:Uncharacterized protein n=1 Tax=Chitinophaga skermanii TaxID=331697 RepID=A0A327QQG6_9BACT|nr:hypothetical protein [Chitinophaga skermanii]RAJ06799.1 hypothetical protein LX64_01926 [Chitinophaga skermanii]
METTLHGPSLPNSGNSRQPWVYAAWLDSIFILSPPFLALACIALFPQVFINGNSSVNVAWWVILVLFIDVAHVYATIYRTYFDRATLAARPRVFLLVPLCAWLVGVGLYICGPLVFWRVLAYLAVYHFIRQQYGFLRIYSRKEKQSKPAQLLDNLTIYATTIYPLLYWHVKGPFVFNWFVEGDFFYWPLQLVLPVANVMYIALLVAYVIKEVVSSIKEKAFNIPKQLLVLGTGMSWYFGIVYFKGDLTFTLLNIISHGIPYMALIWVHGRKQYYQPSSSKGFLKHIFSNYGIVLFLGIIAVLAFVEEGLWDGFVWREHTQFFSVFQSLPVLEDNLWMAVVVPLLAIPQITHYVLDGFIWRMKKDHYNWKSATIG